MESCKPNFILRCKVYVWKQCVRLLLRRDSIFKN